MPIVRRNRSIFAFSAFCPKNIAPGCPPVATRGFTNLTTTENLTPTLDGIITDVQYSS
jgi:hypothetical protein